MPTWAATTLTDEQLAALRERARREAGRFIDPRILRRVVAAGVDPEWAGAVLGHRFGGVNRASWPDVYLIGLALEAEPCPPAPPSIAAARAEHQRQGEEAMAEFRQDLAAWHALAARIPGRVQVVHNYTSHRHLDGYTQGVDHALVSEAFQVGRLHREPGQTLCWAPSRAKDLQQFSDPYDDRIPDCKNCLRIAHRLDPDRTR